MHRFHSSRRALFALLLVTSAAVTRGDDDVPFPLEPPDTSSPYDTYRTFVEGSKAVHETLVDNGGILTYESEDLLRDQVRRVVLCLDLTEEAAFVRDYRGGEASVCIKEVLDRLPAIEASSIPGGPGWGDTELPNRWRIPHTTMAIERVAEGPRTGEYLFSKDTVDTAVESYELVRHLEYRPDATKGFYAWFVSMPRNPWLARIVLALPKWFLERVGGQAIWQWIGLVVVLVLGAVIAFLVYRFGGQQASGFRGQKLVRYWITLWAPTLVLMVPIAINLIIRRELVISGTTLLVVRFAMDVVILVALVVLVIGINTRVIETILASPRIKPRGLDAQLTRLIGRIVGIVVAVIVFLEGGQYLGIPLTTLLAGAGVGGVALALAAQDMLKNLFGSLMILFDKPFRLGERIVAQGYDGVVEEIGLRSTRIRTLTGHQVTIPNEKLACVDIENVGRRPHIRRVSNLRLRLDTSPEKAAEAVEIVRDVLDDHEGMSPDYPARVFLDDFNEDSLNLRMFYWYHPPNYWDFLAFSQKVNLQISERFAAAGIEFALPTSTLQIERDEPGPHDTP